jgi:quinol monooxygenase YgiN
MIQATLRMNAGDNQNIAKALLMVGAQARVEPGCVGCEIHRELERAGNLVYIERWTDWEALKKHLRADLYGQILRIIELSTETPGVEFCELGEPRGLELIESIRLGNGSTDKPALDGGTSR